MGLELYLDLLSQPCRAVYLFAKKTGIPFQLHTVNLFKGQHLTEEFSQVNSLQKVPVLKDGDFFLSESSAILIYLSCRCQVGDHWYPPDLQSRARIHEYLGWHADNIRGTFGVTLWARIIAPLMGLQIPEEEVERNKTGMSQALQQLEDKFLRDKAFLMGQEMTLADLMSLEELMQPVIFGYDVFEGRPRLAAWRE
ncbi:glutathione S-transferase theta-2 [Cavia porcellus]|uniref:glutathione S-transferase theta-2 n=1 Tax=Cavia porcellus TaxID=10141 RepID=UPI002FE02497